MLEIHMLKVKPPLNESLHGAQSAHTWNERIHRTSRAVGLFEEQIGSIHDDGQCRISLHALNTNNFGVCVQELFFMDLLSASDFPGLDPDNELPFLHSRYSRRTLACCEA